MRRRQIYVIGPVIPNRTCAETIDIVDVIERVPTGNAVLMVSYKGSKYPVFGRPGSERIFVGIKDQLGAA
jgi:hypothetical protein